MKASENIKCYRHTLPSSAANCFMSHDRSSLAETVAAKDHELEVETL